MSGRKITQNKDLKINQKLHTKHHEIDHFFHKKNNDFNQIPGIF